MNFETYKNYIPLEKMTTKDCKPEWLIVHCSDSDYDDFESIQRFHITDPSHLWSNIGYNYVIERSGIVREGRPELFHGAHTEGMNTKSIGICICGRFEKKAPNEAQTIALKHLLERLSLAYKIPSSNIVPHRHFTDKKSCYGSFLSDDWARNLLKLNPVEVLKQPIKNLCNPAIKKILLKMNPDWYKTWQKNNNCE